MNNFLKNFYNGNYKKYLIVPILLTILALIIVLIYPGITTGIDLTGGNEIIIRADNPINENDIVSILNEKFSLSELNVTLISSLTSYGAVIKYSKNPIILEAEDLLLKVENKNNSDEETINYANQLGIVLGKEIKDDSANHALVSAQNALMEYKKEFEIELKNALETKLNTELDFQKKEISPTIGASAITSMTQIFLIGFVFITIIIFISFRQIIPSLTIIIAMLFDMLIGLAGMSVLQIPLSLETIPALLMLIGYSVDTNILLTSRVLKNKTGTANERAASSMKTGLTMTVTTIVALTSMILISSFYQMDVIYNIVTILMFGLMGDVVATWLMNAPVILWFVEARKK